MAELTKTLRKAAGKTPTRPLHHKPSAGRMVKLSIAALGVAFGDIGTSPLYAIRECFHGEYGIAVTSENVLGVLSLIFWALLVIVTLKYLTFILRADNHGEGGVLALTALIRLPPGEGKTRGAVLVPLGLFAACLLYGDGMITPAISVLSAVEGIRIVTPVFRPYVIPLTVVILLLLFLVQHRGTARVGRLFGPIIFVWFCGLGMLGIHQILKNPKVLVALSPFYAVEFLVLNGLHGFLVLGAVFLVVTGAEALYADMGHFGKGPIRSVWVLLVLPALLLNYFGQGSLLLANPEEAHHPFYGLVPSWCLMPMVGLATVATIIASQAVITGAFSLTRQAIQLGYLPRLKITHTSAAQMGQIYVGVVNWILMVCTVGLVLGFQSSSNLAAAYGVAVTSTMLITTTLFYVVARERWGWPRWAAGALTGLFFAIDFLFFAANAGKILHGAWFPLVVGGVFFTLMLTWEQGRQVLLHHLRDLSPAMEDFRRSLKEDPPHRIPNRAVFLVGNPDNAPPALVQNLRHNRILHSETAFFHFRTEDVPRVPSLDKIQLEKLGGGFYKVVARYGFMEDPKIENALTLAREKGLEFKLESTSFFLGREKITLAAKPSMSRWRAMLFIFMSQNAMDAAAFFDIPPDQVIEVGVRLEL